jgi:hypothetical protein
VESGVHLTGPSLARVWGRRAGTVEGFTRYSEPLKRATVVWDAATLDRWLEDPQAVVFEYVPRHIFRVMCRSALCGRPLSVHRKATEFPLTTAT